MREIGGIIGRKWAVLKGLVLKLYFSNPTTILGHLNKIYKEIKKIDEVAYETPVN